MRCVDVVCSELVRVREREEAAGDGPQGSAQRADRPRKGVGAGTEECAAKGALKF